MTYIEGILAALLGCHKKVTNQEKWFHSNTYYVSVFVSQLCSANWPDISLPFLADTILAGETEMAVIK
jgi:hypothetical protein